MKIKATSLKTGQVFKHSTKDASYKIYLVMATGLDYVEFISPSGTMKFHKCGDSTVVTLPYSQFEMAEKTFKILKGIKNKRATGIPSLVSW